MKIIAFYALCLVCVYSCNHTFSDKTFADAKWITNNFPIEGDSANNFSDTSHLSIRISSKKVMLGFLKPTNIDTNGAFGKLISIFNRFNATPHNPKTDEKFLFFNGDNAGLISKSIFDQKELFDPKNYTAQRNDLQYQFEAIANEIASNYDKRKFHVVLSDGETTIRKYKNDNTAELSKIEIAVKKILTSQHNVCIGVISLLANFDGDYNYEVDLAAPVKCRRFLYAFCFFDKSFIPEFQRFAESATSSEGGNAFIFNPSLPRSLLDSKYIIYPFRIGAKNKSSSKILASFYFRKIIPDSIVVKNHITNYKNINLPILHFKLLYYMPDAKIKYMLRKEPEVVEEGNCLIDNDSSNFTSAISSIHSLQAGVLRIETIPDYHYSANNFPPGLKIAQQDIADNTIKEIQNIHSPSDILKTEGLKDLYQAIFNALTDIQQNDFSNNFISLLK